MSTLNAPGLAIGRLFVSEGKTSIACFHCGLPIPPNTQLHIQFNGTSQAVCCVGCEAVATTIINADLGNYYHDRSAPAGIAGLTEVNGQLAAFDLPAIQSQYVRTESTGETQSAALYIDGVTCNACLWLAEAALRRVPGVTLADINYVTHRAEMTWHTNQASLAVIIDAITRVGLRATPVASGERQALRAQSKREALKQLGVALLAMMQVMMFTVPLYFTASDDISPDAQNLMRWASLLLTLPVVAYSARPFWIGALRDWHTRHVSMDSPIALAIAATFMTSLWSLAVGQGALYFDSITMFVFLLLTSRYLEAGIRDRALSRIERLTNAAPAVASRLAGYPGNRQISEIASAELCTGDVILISTGQIIAADATLLEGAGEVDESIVTGESRAVIHTVGAALIGGTMNLGAPLIARVERVGSASTLASVARMAERSLGGRPQLMALTDQIARVVAPALIALAVSAGIIWLFINSSQSFNVAVAVLAVTCPCAIALAAPLAYTSATLTIANRGLLISRSHVLETMPQLTDVVFDKTGTLTTGKLGITKIETRHDLSRDEALVIAAALEAGAAHPIVQSIKYITGDRVITAATELRSVPGGGVEGVINGEIYRFGHRDFACTDIGTNVQRHDGAFILSRNGAWLATFHADDELKPDAITTVRALQKAGLRVHLVSGDRAARVNIIAAELGIEKAHIRSQQTPLQKLAYIEQLHACGGKVGMVGDGVNDAPVLGAADVSIAMAAGADLPRLTADAVLLSPHLITIPATLELARHTKNIIKQNFAWAIAYNAIGIPLALANVINPAWAAIGMGVSGLVVVLNSMRLLRVPG